MATKQQWAEVFRNHEVRAQAMIVLHGRLELLRQNNEQPTGLFSFARQAVRWFELNP